MLQKFKSSVRDLLPGRFQVPIKYWFSHVTGGIEAEMALLPLVVTDGRRTIDVGGNRGTYAFRLAALGTRVEVFEPNPACHTMLSAWANGRPKVRIHAVALSSSEGEGELLVPLGNDGVEHDSSGSLEHGADGPVRHVAVPLRTLDSFAFDDVAFIKIDVEGHEASVIAGAHATIAANMPVLLVEIEQRHLERRIDDVFAEISALGYAGYFIRDRRLTPLSDFVVAVDQSIGNLSAPLRYHNNFLFLDARKIAAGAYRALLEARL